MSRKIIGFCAETGCPYEVPGIDDVPKKEDVVDKDELNKYSKLSDRIVTIPTDKLQSDTDIWNNGDPVYVELSSASLKNKSISQSIGVAGRIEIELNSVLKTNEGNLESFIVKEEVPFSCLWHNSSGGSGRITHIMFDFNYVYKINIDLKIAGTTLYIFDLSIDEFYAMSTTIANSGTIHSDGKLNGDDLSDLVPKIKIKSLIVYFI